MDEYLIPGGEGSSDLVLSCRQRPVMTGHAGAESTELEMRVTVTNGQM